MDTVEEGFFLPPVLLGRFWIHLLSCKLNSERIFFQCEEIPSRSCHEFPLEELSILVLEVTSNFGFTLIFIPSDICAQENWRE